MSNEEQERHDKAISEGYKDETCAKCGTLFLAHHHFVRCIVDTCPMKSGKTIFEMLIEKCEQDEKKSLLQSNEMADSEIVEATQKLVSDVQSAAKFDKSLTYNNDEVVLLNRLLMNILPEYDRLKQKEKTT